MEEGGQDDFLIGTGLSGAPGALPGMMELGDGFSEVLLAAGLV